MLLNMILFDGVARRMFIDLLTPIRKERLTEGFKKYGEVKCFWVGGKYSYASGGDN